MNSVEALLRHVPWRYRSLSNYRYAHANRYFTGVLKTPFAPCLRESKNEVHSLVCRRDLNMFLLAAKSFLRYCSDVSLVVHDDGSLGPEENSILMTHLPGVRIIARAEADGIMARVLPEAIRARRLEKIFLLKILDVNYFNKADKTVLLDSDILFLQPPAWIKAWLTQDCKMGFYNQDPLRDTLRVKMDGASLRMAPHFNAGFMGYPGRFGFEELLGDLTKLNYWGEDQTIYGNLLPRRFPLEALNKNEYFVLDGNSPPPDSRMVHFISTWRFKEPSGYISLAKGVIRQLHSFDSLH